MKLIMVVLLLVTSVSYSKTEILFEANYNLKWGMMTIGKVKRSLTKDNDTYIFESVATPQKLARLFTKGIFEKSVFKFNKNEIVPISYEFKQTGRTKKFITHNFKNGVLTISKPKKLVVKSILPNTVDYLSTQVVLMNGLAKGQKDFSLAMYEDSAKPDIYKLSKKAKVKMKVKAGSFDTILIEKTNDLKKGKFVLWCAPKLNYIPVKIMLTNKLGNVFTMELLSIK